MATRNLDLGDIRTRVLRQHRELRARCSGLARAADRASVRAPGALPHLKLVLVRLAVAFEAHLAYEERELGPRLRSLDAWGPSREEAMLAEHVAQRARVESICAGADADPAAADALVADVRWLIASLAVDMEDEERHLAELARLEEGGCVDQMTG